jgi:hypothetical protein
MAPFPISDRLSRIGRFNKPAETERSAPTEDDGTDRLRRRETEPNYFDQLKREEVTTRRFHVTVKRGKGGSRAQIAQFAIDRVGDGYDQVWCVMDVEGPEQTTETRQAADDLRKNSVRPCLSNPAIEVWFLSHFEKTGRPFLNCDQVVERLNKHWQERFKRDYDKADKRIYGCLIPHIEQAIKNSIWVRENHHGPNKSVVDCNSSTEVDLLVAYLRGQEI